MKTRKKLRIFSSLLIAVFMMMSLGITSFAAPATEDTYSIKINRVANDKAAHTYEAYQIFAVSKISGTGASAAVSGVDWGTGVKSDDLLEALKADTTTGTAFAGVTTPAGAAQALEANKGDADFVEAFKNVVSKNLATTADATANMAANADSATIDVTSAGKGYYFVKDQDDSQNNENGAYTQYVLRVLGEEEINAKEVVPTLDKKIVEGNNEVSANTASIGDTVKFRINTAVPDTSAYNRYYFIINDTLCTGLTLDADSFKVYANGSTTALTADKYALTVAADGHSFKLVLKEAKTYSGQDIKVEYDAVLNETANLTSVGNPNTADLTYSNNPNHEYKGLNEPDDTEPGDVVGKTPEITTKTFTTGIKLVKMDGDDNTKLLSGAKFQITGEGVNAVIINGHIFKQSDTGTYYMLKDGNFTETDPTDATKDSYDSTTTMYEMVDVLDKAATTGVTFNSEAYTGIDGVLSFVGLKAGKYTITELEAPEGYNKLDPASITINIEATLDQTAQTCAWTVTRGTEALSLETATNLYTFNVENNQGIVLPGTGGIGTTIFYVVGGLLILCAGALLLTKIRMNSKEK